MKNDGDVVDPDRLQPVATQDRRHRRVADDPDLLSQETAVAPEDEARAEDHVLEPRVLDGLLLLPLGVVVGRDLPALLGAERAHEHEPPGAGLLSRLD